VREVEVCGGAGGCWHEAGAGAGGAEAGVADGAGGRDAGPPRLTNKQVQH